MLATIGAYHNSFGGPFVFDDIASITNNPTIRHLWPIWEALSPPGGGVTVQGRPVINVSLAVNYALGGLDVWGYHALNLAIHLLAGLTLFGIVRRTLLLPALKERFGPAATALALAVSLIWTVHPLQTQSVTYVIQRAESIMGLFYLLTLYCVVRGSASARPRRWHAAAVAACAMGMASKEVMVTAPLIVLLYDCLFLGTSLREVFRRRWGLYLGLAATWGLLAWLVSASGGRGGTAGLEGNVSWPDYAMTQFGVIVHYLQLCFWPHPLASEYGVDVVKEPVQIIPYAIVVGLLLVGAGAALYRRSRLGFLGAWFFAILAPSSSVIPIATEVAAEHRMYLSLAAVVALVVVGGYALWDRLTAHPSGSVPRAAPLRWAAPAAALTAVVAALGYATVLRNQDYRSALAISQDTVTKCPGSPRARNHLAAALAAAGRPQEAIQQYEVSLQLKGDSAEAHYNLGVILADTGKPREAIQHYEQALRLNGDYPEAHNNLGIVLAGVGKLPEAMRHFEQALRLKGDYAEAHNNLGLALARAGKPQQAIQHYEAALQLKGDSAEAHYNLAITLGDMGKFPEAIQHYERTLQLKPDSAEAHSNLGNALAAVGKSPEAIQHYEQALHLKPDDAKAHNNLGVALAGMGRFQEAIQHYAVALQLKGDYAEAHYNLGNALAHAGKFQEAIQHYEQALRFKNDYAKAQRNLAWVLATREPGQGGDGARAVSLAQRACELTGNSSVGYLDTLAAAYAATGQFPEAISTAQKAIQLALSSGQVKSGKEIESRLELYRAGRPYREPVQPTGQPNP